MKERDSRGFWRMIALALKRGTLGKSSHDARTHFTDDDGYWGRVVAAQLGQPAPQRSPEYEPVHAWTRRQCDDYLSRNPAYRLTYETELKQRGVQPSRNVPGLGQRRTIDD